MGLFDGLFGGENTRQKQLDKQEKAATAAPASGPVYHSDNYKAKQEKAATAAPASGPVYHSDNYKAKHPHMGEDAEVQHKARQSIEQWIESGRNKNGD